MKLVAVIDLGSNSVRMSIADVSGDSVKTVFMKRDVIKLSENMNDDMMLKEPAILRAEKALLEFKCIAEDYGCEEIFSVATAAVRKAKNKDMFLNYIKEKTGLCVEVIDGEKEAEYDYFGVLESTDKKDFLIMDIGGGSTEIIGVKNRKLSDYVSIPMGSRSITEQYLKEETKDKIDNALKIFNKETDKLLWLEKFNNLPIIGLGGCLRAIGKAECFVSGIEFKNGLSISTELVYDLFDRLRLMTVDERCLVEGIGDARGDIIIGGLIPFLATARKVNATKLIISDSGIRDGVINSLKNKYNPQ